MQMIWKTFHFRLDESWKVGAEGDVGIGDFDKDENQCLR
jgi:hypothetical protein